MPLDFEPSRSLGVYVHVPFCARRCPYCDFTIAVRRTIPHEAYRDAVLRELSERSEAFDTGAPLVSIFFGGGTPSMLEPRCIGDIITAVRERFPGRVGEVEVSLEANPVDLAVEGRLEAFLEAGVTRVSLGVQSFDRTGLAFLGRDHDGALAESVVERVLASSVRSVSCDLIFGHAEQGLAVFEEDLRTALHLGVHHVSAYSLTIEEGTPFGRRVERGETLTVEEELAVDMYEAADRLLVGFERYEISSLARGAEHRCRHNILYWHGGDYLGLGLGAHSCQRTADGGAVRHSNGRDLKRYLGGELGGEVEPLSPEVHLAERLFLGLRTRLPVSLERVASEHPGGSLERFSASIAELESRGWITRDGDHIATTRQGLLFHDGISRVIFDAV